LQNSKRSLDTHGRLRIVRDFHRSAKSIHVEMENMLGHSGDIIYPAGGSRNGKAGKAGESAGQPVSQSAGRPVSQSGGQPVSPSAGSPVHPFVRRAGLGPSSGFLGARVSRPQNAGRENAGGRKPQRTIGRRLGKRGRESNGCRKGIGKSKEEHRRLPKPGSRQESFKVPSHIGNPEQAEA